MAGEYYGQIFHRILGWKLWRCATSTFSGHGKIPTLAYSGVLSSFILAYLTGVEPVVFGDGEQSRDFTYVANVVDATLRACQAPGAGGKVLNVGTGKSATLNQTLALLNAIFGVAVKPRYAPARAGDVRHSRADIALARATLGYEPRVPLEEGLRRTIEWLRAALTRV